MGKTEAVIFDFDGTLIDATQSIVASFNAVLTGRGLAPWSRQRVLMMMGRPLPEMFAAAFPGNGAPTPELLGEYLLHSRGPGNIPPVLQRGAEETLNRLAGAVKFAIATSRNSDSTGRILSLFGLAHHFATVVGIDHVTRPKPHPEAVLLALERVATKPCNAVLVGDTPDDMQAALGAGVRPIGVATGFHDQEQLLAAGALEVLAHLGDLPALLVDF